MSTAWRRLRISMYILVSIFLLKSCSTSQEENASGPGSGNDTNVYIPKVDTSGYKKSKPHTDTVVISELKFHPEEIKMHPGDTVVWINNDLVAHCVTEANNKAWTSLPIPAGGSWKMVVMHSTDYYCAIHLVMKGKIVVE